ncbi:MAG: SEC-C domain-containing protein [Eubacterium sp.]|nr:SEC-C domain-containing protein [Eubacterium sp.]
MALLEEWKKVAYNQNADRNELEAFWKRYFEKEKNVYAQLLKNPDVEVKGTVKGLAEQFDIELMAMVGFLDGINDSLVTPNPIEEMEEDTEVSLKFDKERLYKNMVDAQADWLYGLEEWNDIFDEETRQRFYKEQKKSRTIVKPKKVGRNEPCPCGSGKKYKNCCMRKDEEAEAQALAR